MNKFFNFKELSYHSRNDNIFKQTNLRTVRYGTETISFLGPKIWNLLLIEYIKKQPLHKFKKKISNPETSECPSRLCKIYIKHVGFIW